MTHDPLTLVTLRAARIALENGDRGRCVGLLAEVWSATRSEAIAAVVARACGSEGPRPQRTGLAGAELWARAWQADPLARTALAGVPWPTSWRLALVRVEAMFSAPDPRVGDILATLAGRYAGPSSYPLWRRVARVLGDQGAARHRSFARAIEQQVPAGPSSFRALIATGAPEALPLDPESVAIVQAIDRMVGRPPGPDLPALLASIYADPDDDDARLVYADALCQIGDPRGEFIHLQVAAHAASADNGGRETRVIDALRRKHGDAWAEGVDVGLVKTGRVFERGFLVGGTWNDVGRSLSHPAWQLIESVTVGSGLISPLHAIFGTHLRRLRRLYGIDSARIAGLLRSPYAPQLTHLGLRTSTGHLPPADRFPMLRELSLHQAPGEILPAAVLRAWASVERWTFQHLDYQLSMIPTWSAGPAVRVMVHGHVRPGAGPDPDGWVTTLTRSNDGAMRCVRIHWAGGHRGRLLLLPHILQGMPVVQSLVVELPDGMAPELRDSAERAIERAGGGPPPRPSGEGGTVVGAG